MGAVGIPEEGAADALDVLWRDMEVEPQGAQAGVLFIDAVHLKGDVGVSDFAAVVLDRLAAPE